MKIAIMQPYFMPYIGYFQMIKTVDKFVVYDNIQFTKKGWIQRNRILNNGKDDLFSLSIQKDSDYLNIFERKLSTDFIEHNTKTLRKIESLYKKAPYFSEIMPLITKIFTYKSHQNLFDFLFYSLQEILKYLSISTEFIISSTIKIDHDLKSQDKVIAICKELKAEQYINAIGGQELYKKEDFAKEGIQLDFIQPLPIEYSQFHHKFVPWLSIIDVLMFNSLEETNVMLSQFELI